MTHFIYKDEESISELEWDEFFDDFMGLIEDRGWYTCGSAKLTSLEDKDEN